MQPPQLEPLSLIENYTPSVRADGPQCRQSRTFRSPAQWLKSGGRERVGRAGGLMRCEHLASPKRLRTVLGGRKMLAGRWHRRSRAASAWTRVGNSADPHVRGGSSVALRKRRPQLGAHHGSSFRMRLVGPGIFGSRSGEPAFAKGASADRTTTRSGEGSIGTQMVERAAPDGSRG